MNCYGKKFNELTELEKQLLHVDSLLSNSIEMYLSGQKLFGGNPEFDMTSGTHDDIEDKFYTRSSIISEILDIKNPNEETIFDIINETQYNFQKFGVDYTTHMGRPIDIYYHYCMKFHEERKLELV